MTDKIPDPKATAALAASFVRDFRARGLLCPSSARRLFLAFLVVQATGISAPNAPAVCAIVVAVAKWIGVTTATADTCGQSPNEVAKHSECVASALPLAANSTEAVLEAAYKQLLASGAERVDLRDALGDDAELVQSPLTPVRSPRKRSVPSAPSTPPKRRRVVDAADGSTSPRTPARDATPATPRTPSRTPQTTVRSNADLGCFAKFVLDSPTPITPARLHRSGVNALDALAAIASNTPRSTAVKSKSLPGTPMSTSVAIGAWLKRVTEARTEDKTGSSRSAELKTLIANDDWERIMGRLSRLLGCYSASGTGVNLEKHETEVLTVYFATLEAILVHEKKRGGKVGGTSFVNKLVRSDNFHACLLSCALETVAAVHGMWDMATINATLLVFGLSPYELTKAISSFARQLPECPKAIARHLITCEQRFVEAVVWQHDSDLVKYMSERSGKTNSASYTSGTATTNKPVSSTMITGTGGHSVDRSNRCRSNSQDVISERKEGVDRALDGITRMENEMKEGAKPENKEGSIPGSAGSVPQVHPTGPESPAPKLSVKDLTLQLFYKKLLYIAQERMFELLSSLNLHFLAEPVFTIIKYALWEKWYLLVDRHLDQIVLCSIYGVAKVRKLNISFRTIVGHYQNASHLKEVTFKPLLPAVFAEISLKQFAPDGPHLPPRPSNDSVVKGDIIKMYNILFMPAMKVFLLQMCGRRNGNLSVGAHSTGTIRGDSDCAVLGDSGSLRRIDSGDPVSVSVLQSPLRARRHHPSPRRIGNVTVSPMSPRAQTLLSLRQSPGVRVRESSVGTSMTPNTRTLYAFGESPVRRQLVTGRQSPVPLTFNRSSERTASIRRMYAERSADATRRRQSE